MIAPHFSMIQPTTQNTISALIAHYGLELEGSGQVDTVIKPWLDRYEPSWIVKAIVESLHRGRYKINSVGRILEDWERLGQPRCRFSTEYERGILERLPEILAMGSSGISLAVDRSNRRNSGMSPPIFINADDLNSEKTLEVEDSLSAIEADLSSHLDSADLSAPAPAEAPVEIPKPPVHRVTSQLLDTLTAIVEPSNRLKQDGDSDSLERIS